VGRSGSFSPDPDPTSVKKAGYGSDLILSTSYRFSVLKSLENKCFIKCLDSDSDPGGQNVQIIIR
jgi:hypothetical protein